jgi:hypothetical protein
MPCNRARRYRPGASRPGRHTTTEEWLNEEDREEQVLRNVSRRRRRLPGRAERHRRRGTQGDGQSRVEDGECHRGCEHGAGWTRLVPLRLGAAIIGRRLRDLRAGRAVFVVMKRTSAVLAARPTRVSGGLPPGTLRRRALREREQAHHRGHTSQDRPHSLRMRWRGLGVKSTRFTRSQPARRFGRLRPESAGPAVASLHRPTTCKRQARRPGM